MKWNSVKCFWVALVLFLRFQWNCCLGCLEEERITLLEFKASCDWIGDQLPSWVNDDCCSWEQVQCNATTGRVIQLSLGGIGGKYEEPGFYITGSSCYINVTIFSTFKELQHLNLSYNRFGDLINNRGFERLTGLRKLEVLDLTLNYFNNSVLPSLGELKSLRTLSLAKNNFGESIPLEGSKSLVGLGKLETLNLGWNSFNSSILPFLGPLTSLKTLSLNDNNLEGSLHMEELANLRNLELLDLSGNQINCSSQAILQGAELANKNNLRYLDLSRNDFNCSSQAIQALCGIKRLQELYLSQNNFEGNIPPCLKNLTSLRILDLSNNQFKGNIPPSFITSLSSLSHIFLGNNDFEGTFTFQSFANNSNLEVIDLSNGGNRLEVETEHPPWAPLFQLKELSLSNCNLNNQSNAIPRFLSRQYELRKVDLSHCNLTDLFPTWLLENNQKLSTLTLGNNLLRGHFLLPSYVHNVAIDIDISNNCIDGLLQENIGNIFPNLEYFNLSKNNLEGGIPSSIGNMSFLTSLDLSNNYFVGEIPKHMATGCNRLSFLGMSNNRFHGQVFPPYFNFTLLSNLRLDNNTFSGNIMSGLTNCQSLEILDISSNQITGRIPRWIGNLTFLTVLNMRGNLLQGNIPVEFQKLEQLEFLDLSQNHLSGSMASLLNSTNLIHLHLQRNGFIGSPSAALIHNSNLMILDISDNDICGGIPDWIGAFSELRVLLLQGNHLNGTIPNHLCKLKHILLMDLSHNSLSGPIPRCFSNITFGRVKDATSISEIGIYSNWGGSTNIGFSGALEEIEFMTKGMIRSYKGDILNFMSGLDLSCNKLTSEIPHEIGTLNGIHALNLSHNQLTGSIPKTFSNLEQIESLDLSYNRLTGGIPSELTTLYNLEVFTVAHNNLTGKTPEMNGQFSTFDSSSYEGNPYLCGLPLPKSSFCSSDEESTNTFATTSNDVENVQGIDMTAFASSFAASYVVCLLGIATILYINPYWRRMWFHFIGACMCSCHDFLSDTYYKLYIHERRFCLLIWKALVE